MQLDFPIVLAFLTIGNKFGFAALRFNLKRTIPDKKIKKKISSNLSNQQEAGFL